jgi:hypothetical protein
MLSVLTDNPFTNPPSSTCLKFSSAFSTAVVSLRFEEADVYFGEKNPKAVKCASPTINTAPQPFSEASVVNRACDRRTANP